MNGLICITVLALVGAGLHQAHRWGYDRGYHEGYEDGDYEGYRCGVEDSNRQFKNICDEIISNKDENICEQKGQRL